MKKPISSFGQEIVRAWHKLSDGWHGLLCRSSQFKSPFKRWRAQHSKAISLTDSLPYWSLWDGEVEESATEVIVRIEMPGISPKDFVLSLEGNTLYLSGHKMYFRDEVGDFAIRITERTYGVFQRAILLPCNVSLGGVKVTYDLGVVTVRFPKGRSEAVHITL